MTDLEKLAPFGPGGMVHVVVEAARGMAVKCKYEPDLGAFMFGKPLPHGLVYPFDWGFIPSTRGEDGDPLDALVLHDVACPVGCLIRCQPVAMLSIEQREDGKRRRNDRFLLRPAADQAMKEQHVLTPRLKLELETFFQGVVLGSGKSLMFHGWHGPEKALAAIHKGARSYRAGAGLMPSSVIRRFNYRPDEASLEITFVSGRRYRYLDVPPELFQRMRESFSKGEFFNQHIRDHFAFEKADDIN